MAEDNDNNGNAVDHTEVSGAINQHTPPYWRLALPALGVRYAATFFQDFTNQTHALKSKYAKYFDAAAGLWMMAVTTFFASRTLSDMKSLFAETVAYEFDKKPSDIGISDLMQSQNKAVIRARGNLIKYNGLRALVNSSFFASWIPWKPFKNWKSLDEISSINLGMGANSAYLVGEVLGRGRTFFEQYQSFTDSKLNPQNALGDEIKPIDLIHLYERNARDNDPQNAFNGRVDTPMWKNSQVIFERMAELMNQTYHKIPQKEHAGFIGPKFIYLIGHNLVQPKNVEQTLAFIEVVNHYGIDALKKVVNEVRSGNSLANALQSYPVTIPGMAQAVPAAEAVTEKRHTDKMPAPAAAYTDKVAKNADSAINTQAI